MGMRSQIRSFDHTADVGIEVRAPDREALFEGAAVGLAALILGEDEATSTGDDPESARDFVVAVEARDGPSLLVAWLRELVYHLSVTPGRIAHVTFETLDETKLRATVAVAPTRERPVREIKGVTYHDLQLERQPDGWFGRVIFDV